MLFNSIEFVAFLPIVYALYWLITNKKLSTQNVLLLLASYFFYSCWDWRFVFLLMFSTFLDYFSGIQIDKEKNPLKRKIWLFVCIGINLGFLGVFKYYNFFIDNFVHLLNTVGIQANITSLQVILPVGISFYTFHGLSYVIDIYKRRIPSEKNFVQYALFVSYFPLLVAGPIERATHLLPQIKKPRIFSRAQSVDGLKQILWGFFKKVVIADNCATYVNQIFDNSADYNGSTLFLGAVLFAFQIYGDFSGYSDIATGTSKLFGIELLKNFNYPYFSRNISEFWRRWHISLSSWFRDYLYIPLGGSKGGTLMKVRNTFIIFIVSGFWHGANWTFIVWGALNALLMMPSVILGTNRNHLDIVAKGNIWPTLRDALSIFLTFILTTFVWIFFRAKDIHHALSYIAGIFSENFFTNPRLIKGNILILIVFFMIVEWFGRENDFAIDKLFLQKKWIRYTFYYLLIILIFWFGTDKQQFIYFQF